MKKNIKEIFHESITLKKRILSDDKFLENIISITNNLVKVLKSGNRIFLCGNGGSAADAQHIAAELTGRFQKNRKALAAEAIHCNTSYITAVANDYAYDIIYSRYMDGWGSKGDAIIGLSTSGNSKNIIECFKTCQEKKIYTIGFTGETGGKLEKLSDHILKVPSKVTPRIQEVHMLVGHIICQAIEESLFSSIS